MRTVLSVITVLCLLATALPAAANVCGEPPDTLILLDRSGSMTELVDGQSKWAIAKSTLSTVTSNYANQLKFGLMLFSRYPNVDRCTTAQINVGVGTNNSSAISTLLSQVAPYGDTPIAYSMDAARTYLQSVKSTVPQYLILITDGMETCTDHSVNSSWDAASRLLGDGVKTYVIGFGDGVREDWLTNTASSGGTGNYIQADNMSQLTGALDQIAAELSCCGDGKKDPGELCDPTAPAPDNCPTSCDDGNPCTVDTLNGSGCNVYCSYEPVTAMINGDGCCPPGANSATDSDCSPACGNGVLDPGEKCDTGIPPGQWGACPLTCNDSNVCTEDKMMGSGCQAYCVHTNICGGDLCGNGKVDAGEWCDTGIPQGQAGACPLSCDDNDVCTHDTLMGSDCLATCSNVRITQPIPNDGCCPPGATFATDNDCPAACGNGVLDPGETCDPAIPAGQQGACITSCDDGDPCTEDYLTGSACNLSCVHNPLPPNPTVSDGCCPPGASPAQDYDCAMKCDPDGSQECVDPACEGIICPDGYFCSAGQCLPWPEDPSNSNNNNGSGLGPEGDVSGGCQCNTPASASTLPLGALLLVVVLALGRRRRA